MRVNGPKDFEVFPQGEEVIVAGDPEPGQEADAKRSNEDDHEEEAFVLHNGYWEMGIRNWLLEND